MDGWLKECLFSRDEAHEGTLLDALIEEYTEAEDTDLGEALRVSATGVTIECLLHPLDTVSSRAKVLPDTVGFRRLFQTIFQEEGLRGLYAGMSVTMMVSLPSTFLYFLGYEAVKRAGVDALPPSMFPAVHFVAGAAAEVLSSLFFVPMDVVRTRLQLGANPSRATGGVVSATVNYGSVRSALRAIATKEGVHGLYAGWNSCLLQDCTFSALQFVFYEQCKRWYRHTHDKPPTKLDSLLYGGIAGGAAALLTNPIDTLTTRLQAQGEGRRFGHGVFGVVRNMMAEGAPAFWRGALPRVMHFAPLSAVQFTMYEVSLRVISPH